MGYTVRNGKLIRREEWEPEWVRWFELLDGKMSELYGDRDARERHEGRHGEPQRLTEAARMITTAVEALEAEGIYSPTHRPHRSGEAVRKPVQRGRGSSTSDPA
jgi:hypothetical protein